MNIRMITKEKLSRVTRGVLGACVALGAWAAVAASVEITGVAHTPGSGKATVNYTVSGLSTRTDLTIKASANGKSMSVAVASVANGSGSKEINYGATLGVAPNVAFSAIMTDPDTEGVQLWEGGPYWATCNVGAARPEDCGYYFWWGDTVGYRYLNSKWEAVTSSTTINFSSGAEPANNTYGKEIDQLKTAGYLNANSNLVSTCDAATAYLGAPWRMPTEAELNDLISKCTSTWTTQNGVAGRLFTGNTAGYTDKSIFLPATGFGYGSVELVGAGSDGGYWSSTPCAGSSNSAWTLIFSSSEFRRYDSGRYGGLPVRPVRGFAE